MAWPVVEEELRTFKSQKVLGHPHYAKAPLWLRGQMVNTKRDWLASDVQVFLYLNNLNWVEVEPETQDKELWGLDREQVFPWETTSAMASLASGTVASCREEALSYES
ncbi:hypothetical protein P7K49_006736 [Saguinus oedipus]|uniref:Uncharacterized protein n=1 Tax=Saguinus oedipus TaxID=9490 RepID=A0ABQ9W3R8_SAGOE|nr:hypothetical protein P7K49_006736 [Saguinus oedipus]